MPRSDKNGERHEVHCSGVIAQNIRRLQRQAAQEGRGDEFVAALREMLRRLRRDPMEFGEPLYRMPAMRMQVRSGGIPPLFMHFAVSDDESLVFIKGVTLQPQQSS